MKVAIRILKKEMKRRDVVFKKDNTNKKLEDEMLSLNGAIVALTDAYCSRKGTKRNPFFRETLAHIHGGRLLNAHLLWEYVANAMLRIHFKSHTFSLN